MKCHPVNVQDMQKELCPSNSAWPQPALLGLHIFRWHSILDRTISIGSFTPSILLALFENENRQSIWKIPCRVTYWVAAAAAKILKSASDLHTHPWFSFNGLAIINPDKSDDNFFQFKPMPVLFPFASKHWPGRHYQILSKHLGWPWTVSSHSDQNNKPL